MCVFFFFIFFFAYFHTRYYLTAYCGFFIYAGDPADREYGFGGTEDDGGAALFITGKNIPGFLSKKEKKKKGGLGGLQKKRAR